MALKLEIDVGDNITWTDFTPVLKSRTLTVRLNTVDFELIDPSATLYVPVIGYHVRIVALSWLGTIQSYESRDAVDRRNAGIVLWNYTATNTASPLPVANGASYTLSDQPTMVTDTILLEDGSGGISLEDGTLTAPGLIEMEGALPGYQQLTRKVQSNNTPIVGLFGTLPGTSTLGSFTTFQGGLWPGIQFFLVSNNQAINTSTLWTVSEVAITFPLAGDQAFYRVTFGSPTTVGPFGTGVSQDSPWTLRVWVQGLIHG